MTAFASALRLGRKLVFALVMFVFAGQAIAEAAASTDAIGARWSCWLASADLTIRCLLRRGPEDGFAERAAAVERSIDPRLPQLVQTIWGSPEALDGLQITIPLWNYPDDMNFAAELADSVMCGRRDDCAVSFDSNQDGMAQIRVAAMRSGNSEDEVLAEMTRQGFVVVPTKIEKSEIAQTEEQPRRRRRSRDA